LRSDVHNRAGVCTPKSYVAIADSLAAASKTRLQPCSWHTGQDIATCTARLKKKHGTFCAKIRSPQAINLACLPADTGVHVVERWTHQQKTSNVDTVVNSNIARLPASAPAKTVKPTSCGNNVGGRIVGR
jgi:hypothetical protein